MVLLLLEVFQNEDHLSYVVLNWSSSWSCFVLMMPVDCCGRYKHEKDKDEWMEIFSTDEAAKLRENMIKLFRWNPFINLANRSFIVP